MTNILNLNFFFLLNISSCNTVRFYENLLLKDSTVEMVKSNKEINVYDKKRKKKKERTKTENTE